MRIHISAPILRGGKRAAWAALLMFLLWGLISCSGMETTTTNQTPFSDSDKSAQVNSTANSTPEGPPPDSPSSLEQQNATVLTGRDIAEDFTQSLEEEVWPESVLMPPSELPGQESGKSRANRTAAMEEEVFADLDFQIEIQNTEIMRDYVDYYTRRHRRTFLQWLNRSERYLPYIREVFAEHNLPQDLIFLPFAESGFNPFAYSSAGAAGMWQFMPYTARHYGLRVNWWVDERRDPYRSTQAAATYLKKLYNQFDSWYLALAAYNAGEGNLQRALRQSNSDGFFEMCRNTGYLERETRYYVPKFLAILKIVKNSQEYDLPKLDLDSGSAPARIEVPSGTDLASLSRAVGLKWDDFRRHNPFFRRRVTPPGEDSLVYLPGEKKELALEYLQESSGSRDSEYARYRVQRGDSWWRLSKRFNVPIRILKDINNKSSDLLHPGESLLVPTAASRMAKTRQKAEQGSAYVVKKGDTLAQIAHRFGVGVDKLRRANQMDGDQHIIRPGQRLQIPSSKISEKRALARKRSNYVVREGDSLWDISRRFGVSMESIIAANALDNPKMLREGTELFIPGQTETAEGEGVSGKEIVYQVRKGDNLWSIARKFGVSTNQILSWNALDGEPTIHPGDELKIRLQK